MGGNIKLASYLLKTGKNHHQVKIYLIVTNGPRLDFKEIPESRQYQFRTLKNDELDIVKNF